MWRFLKVSISVIAILFVGLMSYFYYLEYIGPELVGPKTEVDAICETIKPGMTLEQIQDSRAMTLADLGIESAAGPDMSMINSARLQVDIHYKSGFACICQVDIEDDITTGAGEVFCVD